jgi:hypothetical protein
VRTTADQGHATIEAFATIRITYRIHGFASISAPKRRTSIQRVSPEMKTNSELFSYGRRTFDPFFIDAWPVSIDIKATIV